MDHKLLLQLNTSWEENQSHLHNLQRIMLKFSYNKFIYDSGPEVSV